MAAHNPQRKHGNRDAQSQRDGRKAKHAIRERDEKRVRRYCPE